MMLQNGLSLPRESERAVGCCVGLTYTEFACLTREMVVIQYDSRKITKKSKRALTIWGPLLLSTPRKRKGNLE